MGEVDLSARDQITFAEAKRGDLHRKYSALCRITVPTGDPTIPSYVLKAKSIREQMTELAVIGDAEASEDD